MVCRNCRKGICRVINLSKKYEAILARISPGLLLPYTEFGILQTLKTEDRSMHASEIALELDRSHQLVGKRGKMLAERGLVKRDENEQGRRTFQITDLATKSYFADADSVRPEIPLHSTESDQTES